MSPGPDQRGGELGARLGEVPLFADLTPYQLAWLASHGETRRLAQGERLAGEGEAASRFWVILSGDIRMNKLVNGRRTHLWRLGAGGFFGHEQLLLQTPYLASVDALSECVLYGLSEQMFWEMLSLCPELRTPILTTLAQRLRAMEELSQTQAKLVSLGSMAAGLAHELGNPASALVRSTQILREQFQGYRELLFEACACGLEASRRARLRSLVEAAAAQPGESTPDALERLDRETGMEDLLRAHGLRLDGDTLGDVAASGLSLEDLSQLVDGLGPDMALRCLRILGVELTAARLFAEVGDAAARISGLVGSVTSYSHMDAQDLREIDVRQGLNTTLNMLSYRLKGVELRREYAEELPLVRAQAGELNQVWTNLLVNALDALESAGAKPGRLTVRTRVECGEVAVEVEDNGAGIRAEVRERLFEPFFTTKDVGKGTGLGLDIARRIVVEHYGGEIRVDSRPGRTIFTVVLPVAADASCPTGRAGGEGPPFPYPSV